MTDILPCPFCGEAPRVYPAQLMIDGECPESISCDNGDCLAGPSTGYLPLERAIAAWNTRTPTPAPNAGAVKAKPLVWEIHPMGWIAAPPTGHAYIIDVRIKGRAMFIKGMNPPPKFSDLEAAKAAAQADYEARIMAAIEGTPDPRDAVIARLVESAELVSEWDEWAYQIGGVCPDRLVNCMGKLRAALAAAKDVMK